MTTIVAAGRRVLPRGWTDLARQVAIWFGFLLAYQVARGLAGHNPTKAFADGLRVIDFEQRISSTLWELTFQNFAILVAPARDRGGLDVLELGVHRRRALRCSGSTSAATTRSRASATRSCSRT